MILFSDSRLTIGKQNIPENIISTAGANISRVFLPPVHCREKRRVKIRVLMQEGKEKAWLGVRRSAESTPDNM